jgi:IS5 family transposase
MSYDRMKKDEARIAAEVEALLSKAEQVDAEEDALYGVGEDPLDLPAELQRREDRIAKIREARAALEKDARRARAAVLRQQAVDLRAKAEQPIHSTRDRKTAATLAAKRDLQASLFDDDDSDPPPSMPSDDLPVGTPPMNADGKPTPKAQRNFTDPESRIMVRDGGFIQAYNAQLAVDGPSQVIVAAALSNNAADAGYFEPLLSRTVNNCGAVPETVTADAGYFSESNIQVAESLGSEPFVSVGKHRNDGTLEERPEHSGRLSPSRLAMRELLNSPRGRAIYARRKSTVEPVFGQIRCCQGFQKLSFRGLFKSRCEWTFVALAHNVRKLFRAAAAAPTALAAA